MLTEEDIRLFRDGTHASLYGKFGCQLRPGGGAQFAVWAPHANAVSVIGEWNSWHPGADALHARGDGSGVWEGSAAIAPGQAYKYRVTSGADGRSVDKADPFAFYAEVPPAQASRAWAFDYEWGDAKWMKERAAHNALNAPMSIYEVHLGSWRRGEDHRMLGYREIAPQLAQYAMQLGFTHVELMPVTEHPFYGSWGYQTTGYFAPSARYGTPQDFMYLVDVLHRAGLGVILDWVPSHFPGDPHGLARFDGTALYEHEDPRQGFHPEWNSHIFNYGRHEVRSFLLSSALWWLERYHLDGLRVDGVASMLYLDYARKHGEWIPNKFGGHENLEAVHFLRELNTLAYQKHPETQSIAEESTAWPQVSRPVYGGGLGFGMKWNMGWMHDTLRYLKDDPIHRRHHHGELTFSLVYAFTENFVLALSHDEVVHGKGSLYSRMPGDAWQKFANLRLLYGYMWTHPGKKLLFMGCEFAQVAEWGHEQALEWEHAARPAPTGVQRWITDLNRAYRAERALHERDFSASGFEWIDHSDAHASVLAFLRKSAGGAVVAVVCNFTPVVRHNYRVGVPVGGAWQELLNSDSEIYGGSGQGNLGRVEASDTHSHGRPFSIELVLPPLGVLVLKPEGR